jgi:hypothetical protein
VRRTSGGPRVCGSWTRDRRDKRDHHSLRPPDGSGNIRERPPARLAARTPASLHVNKARLKKRRGDLRAPGASWFRGSGHHGCADSATESGSWLSRGHRTRQVGLGWAGSPAVGVWRLGFPGSQPTLACWLDRLATPIVSAIPWGFSPLALLSVRPARYEGTFCRRGPGHGDIAVGSLSV